MTEIELARLGAMLIAALMAGLLGSGHCFGMCGGIAGSLGAMSGLPGKRSSVFPAIQFNLGRILSYALLGAVTAGILGGVGDLVALKSAGKWLRGLTAMLVLLIGLRFLLDWRGLDLLERGGAGIWKRILPLAVKISTRHDWIGRLGLGLCWGFIPCGLVYTMLLTAASTGDSVIGASVMVAFGAGTLPSMLGLSLAAPALNSFLSDTLVRRIVGFSLVILAAWMFYTLVWGHQAHAETSGHEHHESHRTAQIIKRSNGSS